MNNNQIVKVTKVDVIEGDLYRIDTEDGEAFVFDSQIIATLEDGTQVIHGRFNIPGYKTDEEGFKCPNYNYKNESQAIVDRITKVGKINLQYWFFYHPEPLQSCLQRYGFEENCERVGIRYY